MSELARETRFLCRGATRSTTLRAEVCPSHASERRPRTWFEAGSSLSSPLVESCHEVGQGSRSGRCRGPGGGSRRLDRPGRLRPAVLRRVVVLQQGVLVLHVPLQALCRLPDVLLQLLHLVPG